MLNQAIESLEEEIVSLKDQTAQEIKGIDAYLSQPGGKSKLRPRIVPNKGYSTFSIIWQRLVFYNFTTHKAILKAIRKGRGHLVSKSRLLSRCRDCAEWETGYIWEKEQWFAGVRRKVALLSSGVSALKQYCSIELVVEKPEQSSSASTGMEPQEVIKSLTVTFKRLKDLTCQTISEVSARLAEDGRTGLKPNIRTGNGAGFTVEWFKPNGSDPEAGQPIERQIPREGKYSMRRSRLLAHCRDCEAEEQEYIWEKELEFARIRKQADLLTQAMTALKQYAKEAD